MSTIYFKKWSAPICDLYFYADDSALLILAFEKTHKKLAAKLDLTELSTKSSPIIENTIRQLKEYFAGERSRFEVPMRPNGTEFQQAAWKELSRIPFGKTLSYGEQAKRFATKSSVRAVGSANGRNPISIIVPCHRVISSDGKISGYAGGPEVKKKLLDLENPGRT